MKSLQHKERIKQILDKNNINKTLKARRFSGGQVNLTYQIGNEFVLKIDNDWGVIDHQPSIMKLGIDAGAKIPKIIDAGIIDGRSYMLMEKLPGKKLSCDWPGLSETKKETLIKQICEQLEILHSITFDKYSTDRKSKFDTMLEAYDSEVDFSEIDYNKLDKETTSSVELVKEFYQDNRQLLNERGAAVFVHNDLHFENILYQNNEITGLIDFDFSRQMAKDHELWHMIDFFFNPLFYVVKPLHSKWSNYKLGNEIQMFQKYYPELFSHPDLMTRLRLYLVCHIVYALSTGGNAANIKTNNYYKSDWLEQNVALQ